MYFMNERQRIIQHPIFIIRTPRRLLRLIASCGLLPAVLIGAVSAQHPAPAAPSTQSADSAPGISGAANGRAVSSCVSERERILLERMRSRSLTQDETRSEEHTSELQSLTNLVCRLLLEKKTPRPTTRTPKRLPYHQWF